ncbi:MAG: hypothetical protein GTO18_11025 [Anaerolineales bacterium]|nr:hypothetical protein [Anaerolineales bacterium]
MRKALRVFVLMIVSWVSMMACSSVEATTIAHPTATYTPVPRQVIPLPTPTLEDQEPLSVKLVSGLQEDKAEPLDPVVLQFNKPMDIESAEPAIALFPEVEGVPEWDESGMRFTFTPDREFKLGVTYTITINPDLVSDEGEAMEYSDPILFFVQGKPEVVRHIPEASRLTERRPSIVVIFNRSMSLTSLITAVSVHPEVSFGLDKVSGEEIHILLHEPLQPGLRYRFTIEGSVTDSGGIPLGDDYVWEYWLEDLRVQVNGPARASQDQKLLVSLNYPVQPESFENAIMVEPPIEGEYTWNRDGHYASIMLDEPLLTDTTYTFNFNSPLQSLDGTKLTIPGSVQYHSPPPILSHSPASDERYVDNHTVSVEFYRPMDHERTEAAFQIDPPLPGYFTWEGNRLMFHLDSVMVTRTQYKVTIDDTALDADGNKVLSAPYSWSFMSAHYLGAAGFGEYGAKIQVVDTHGLRPVQFALGRSEPTRVFFDLHRLTMRQLVDLAVEEPSFRNPRLYEVKGATDLVRSWEITSGLENEHWNIKQVYIPQDVPPGLYVLSMEIDNRLQDQIVVVLTENNIVAKTSGNQLHAWVTDIHGEPVKNVEIRVYDEDGGHIREAGVNEHGVYVTQLAPAEEPFMVLARTEKGDVAVVGVDSTWHSGTRNIWRWRSIRQDGIRTFKAYVYTDRPIYRPGQSVQFKAILRTDDDLSYSLLPANTAVELRIRDARDNLLQTYELTMNDFGSIQGEFQIAEGAVLGEYGIEVELDGEVERGRFKVQDYRVPDVALEVTADAGAYVQGDSIFLNVDATYLFGEPVGGAEITIRQYELGEFYGYWWEEEVDEDEQYVWYRTSGNVISARLDPTGHYSTMIEARMGQPEHTRYSWRDNLSTSTWGIEVTLDDGSRQTVSAFVIVKVFSAAEKLGLDQGGYWKMVNESFDVNIEVSTIHDEAVPDRTLTLEVWEWDRRHYDYGSVQSEHTVTTGVDGTAEVELRVSEPGRYQLLLRGTDERGNDIEMKRWIIVDDSSNRRFFLQNMDDISISADRDHYSPYETATLFIESGFDGPALLTIERGKVHRELAVALTPPITIVEVPILESDAPNIFVKVNAWKPESTTPSEYEYTNLPESRLLTDSVELTVDLIGKQLDVDITTNQEFYLPGEEASVTISVTDWQGDPAFAEVSLALVDEGIYLLSDDLAGPILDAFYGRRENSVVTYDSMAPSRWIWSPGMGGGGGGEPSWGMADPRSDFRDTAVWFPNLHTGADGQVTVTFTLPDNLTTWRLSARAVTKGTWVGESTETITTRQEMVIRPVLPRVLTVGDEFLLTAFIHNYSQEWHRTEVFLEAEGLNILEDADREIDLRPGEMGVLGWQVVAVNPGEVPVTIHADADTIGDAVTISLPIQPLAVPDVLTENGLIGDDHQTTIYVPVNALDMSSVQIEFSRSISGNLLAGVEYLTGFPYGCVEQIMSKALPNAVVGRALNKIGEVNPGQLGDLAGKVNHGTQMLYAKQHRDGGWGWWYDDQSHDYQTAWVVFGLSVTASAGYEVDPDVIRRGVVWLGSNLESMDSRTRAFALYAMALAGEGELEMTLDLAERWVELDAFSQAALALALFDMDEPEAAEEMLHRLEASAVVKDSMVYWPAAHGDGEYNKKNMASSVRGTALILSAFTRIQPEHEYVPSIVNWLMGERQRYGWGTTNETSFAVLALTDYVLSTREYKSETTFMVHLNGDLVSQGTLTPQEPIITIEIESGRMDEGENVIDIQKAGEGKLYYVLTSEMYLHTSEIEAAGDVLIERTYYDAATNKPVSELTAGSLVRVSLKVKVPEDGFYVLIEDQLPGGFEALNEGLNVESHVVNEEGHEVHYWKDLGYNYKEVHADRVSFFVSHFRAGTSQFDYYARAKTMGEFNAMPSIVSAMYDPSMWGRSSSANLVVIGDLPEGSVSRGD